MKNDVKHNMKHNVKHNTQYLKSPMNYIGNKYRLLGQIIPLFPSVSKFVDLFAGGLDVAINFSAKETICNDINTHLIDIYCAFQQYTYEELMEYFMKRIEEYGLSKTNEEGYKKYRDYYNHLNKRSLDESSLNEGSLDGSSLNESSLNQNSLDKSPLDLYLLMNYGFNYQLRFNANHEYNTSFGRERSSFNPNLQKRLKSFVERIKEFKFTCKDFRSFDYDELKEGDLIYCDPPYTISTGPYNDGRREFAEWCEADDIALTEILDLLSQRGVYFALSNVLIHKGCENNVLINWSKKYHVHNIISSYNNCNYHTTNKNHDTFEVLITNVQK